MTIGFHTLGCKVNQYDTQAMRELLLAKGYDAVPFHSDADIYLLNTCTVTGTGDRKSLQIARRIKREHPDSLLILCGCLAQKEGERLLDQTGADLILGTQNRSRIADLLETLRKDGGPICAVDPLGPDLPFEPLRISSISGHTRATVKIQEGCGNHCTYCVIPSVRGGVRSRPLSEIRSEILRLRDAGFVEIVLTGIHLASYGLDGPGRNGGSLIDAISVVHETDGIQRIRLGSLEPGVATESFCASLKDMPKICPQFHLALQSGSNSVLARMKRRYNTEQYLAAASRLRSVFPRAAFTTDILTGFPGETEDEFRETKDFIEKMAYARIHVFPFSPRAGTPAAGMPGQLSRAEKENRARILISVGEHTARKYLETWLGETAVLLPEEKISGKWEGYSPEYIRITLPENALCQSGVPVSVRLTGFTSGGMSAEIIK